MNVVAFCGSLRAHSFNRYALRAAQELAPPGMVIEVAEIRDIPLYDEDMRAGGDPAVVVALRNKVRAADALLIATPEYNFSVPGVLKNAIDWISRVPDQPFNEKPLAIIGASTGILGTGRAQYHLRQMAVFLNMHPVNKPEVFIARAQDKFDAQGTLIDTHAREVIAALLISLQAWTARLSGL